MSSCLSLSVCDRHKLNSSLSLRPRRAPSSSSPTTETGLIFQPAPCWRTKSYLATSASWTTSALFFQYTHTHTLPHHVTQLALSQSCDLFVMFTRHQQIVEGSCLEAVCDCMCSAPLQSMVGIYCPLQAFYGMI